MVQQTNSMPLTEDLWNDLRQKMQSMARIPGWVAAVCLKPFSEISAWPAELHGAGTTKPQIRVMKRDAFLKISQSISFARSASKQAEEHQAEINAIRQLACENVITLNITSSDQAFYCYFDENTRQPVHFSQVHGQFVKWPRWKELLLAWKGILAVITIVGVVTWVTAVTLKGMVLIFAVSLMLYMAILMAFGSSHIIEGAVIAVMIAGLGGCTDRMLYNKLHRSQEQTQTNTANLNENQR